MIQGATFSRNDEHFAFCSSSFLGTAVRLPHRCRSQTRTHSRRPRIRSALINESNETATAPKQFIPDRANAITCEAAQRMLQRMECTPIKTSLVPEPIDTCHVISCSPSSSAKSSSAKKKLVMIFLHGFDSNLLEYRFFLPLVDTLRYDEYEIQTHFVDVLGWGLTARPVGISYGPEAKRAHLESYITQFVDLDESTSLILGGASLGGAIAIDLLLNSTHPQLAARTRALVLLDPQAFTDKEKSRIPIPFWVAGLGAEVLRSDWLRRQAAKMSYTSPSLKNSEQVMRIGRLHCECDGWKEATVDFIRGEGYCLSQRVGEVNVPTLVVWGEDDNVLDKKDAAKFKDTIDDCELVYVDECGHSPHIEKPDAIFNLVSDFVNRLRDGGSLS